MPIITHTLTSNPQPDGRISYILRMYDQDGTERMLGGLLPAGFDTAAFVTSKIAETDVELAETEFRNIVGL